MIFLSTQNERPLKPSTSFQRIKDFAKKPQKALSIASRRSSSPSHGFDDGKLTLKEPVTPPLPYKSQDLRLRMSGFSSFESLTLDTSGFTHLSSHPTTPSPAKPLAFFARPDSSSVEHFMMGQNTSSIKRKRVQEKPSLDAFSISPPKVSPDVSPKNSSAEQAPTDPVLRKRPSSVLVPIPRRRSSLTALHLDSSHFETPLSGHDVLKHRASTLTSTYKQEAKSSETITPFQKPMSRDTLSATLLSTASSNRMSVSPDLINSPASPVLSHIHLPKTFPDGLIPTPKPPLTNIHHKCYTHHQRMPRSSNKVYPVPCMTCGNMEGEVFWKCVWCYLRICGECMAEFSGRGRKLDVLLAWMERRKNDSASPEKETKPGEKAASQPSWGAAKGKRVKQLLEVKEAQALVKEEKKWASPLRNSTG